MWMWIGLAVAQDRPSCANALMDVFPADEAVVPADARFQVSVRDDCNLDAFQGELLDADGGLVEAYPRFDSHLHEWDPDVVPGEAYALRLFASDSVVERTFAFTVDTEPTGGDPVAPTVSELVARRFDLEPEAVIEMVVSGPDDPNLRIHVLDTNGDLLQVFPVDGAETWVAVSTTEGFVVAPDGGEQVCARVALRDPTGERTEADGPLCTEVLLETSPVPDLPAGPVLCGCSTGEPRAVGLILGVLPFLLRRRRRWRAQPWTHHSTWNSTGAANTSESARSRIPPCPRISRP
jgi:MYXO-CTERM domain-containing protein